MLQRCAGLKAIFGLVWNSTFVCIMCQNAINAAAITKPALPSHLLPIAANLSIPTDSCIEYKLVHIIPGQAPQWEFSPNRTLTFQAGSPARALSLAWCDPVPVTAEDESPEDDSVDSLTIPFSSDDASSAELAVAINDTEQSMMAVAAETTVEDEPIPEEIPGKEEIVLPSVVVMEDAAPSDVSAVLELGQDEFETDASSNDGSNFLEGAARTAGYVALGVAGAAMLSAFAIDVADTAVLGAVVAAAGGAALSSKNGSAAKKKDSLSEDGTENTDEIEEPLITGAGQPGVVIAAGILSALDAGKSVAKALSGESETREDA